MARKRGFHWEAASVRRLRLALRVSQRGLADELGVRQQTISEWETGVYQPRGASARLLDIVAERSGLTWAEGPAADAQGSAAERRETQRDATEDGP
ncbi:MAG: helix-turn-helix domain-containing protein [Chloroflexi bacterium]|nr:helix-turn-helix domain-containing protein [Chloroflexota bacterium]